MRFSVKLSDYAKMSEDDKKKTIEKLLEVARSPGQQEDIDRLNDQIHDFEFRYGITSEVLIEELNQGKREETLEICNWLMLVHRRLRLLSKMR